MSNIGVVKLSPWEWPKGSSSFKSVDSRGLYFSIEILLNFLLKLYNSPWLNLFFFFKFISFRVLENALVNPKIRSRDFYSCLLTRMLPKVFIICPRKWEIIPPPKQLFLKIFQGGMVRQCILRFLHFYNFYKIFPHPL